MKPSLGQLGLPETSEQVPVNVRHDPNIWDAGYVAQHAVATPPGKTPVSPCFVRLP